MILFIKHDIRKVVKSSAISRDARLLRFSTLFGSRDGSGTKERKKKKRDADPERVYGDRRKRVVYSRVIRGMVVVTGIWRR